MENTQSVKLFGDSLKVNVAEYGSGRPYLILHGGAGPATVKSLAEGLSKSGMAIVPTYPGFNGEPRPEWFATLEDLALAHLELIDRLDLNDVVIVGNSVGGWIASEMAYRNSPRITGIVLLDAVGIDTGSPDKLIPDPSKLPLEQTLALSFHNPQKFAIRPPNPEAGKIMAQVQAQNQATLKVYSGQFPQGDPSLRAKLARVSCPALVVWGESDRIVDPEYGRRFAESIPGARFELVSEAGHLPQIERLDEVLRLISEFAKKRSVAP